MATPTPPSPPSSAPGRPAHRNPWLWLAVGITAAVLVGLVAVVVWYLDRGPSHPEAWDPRVEPLVRFVESERGRRFEHPVEVHFLDEDDYRRRITTPPDALAGEAEGWDEQAEVDLAVQRALGLVDGTLDTEEASDDLAADGSSAFYDQYVDEIVVAGTELTPLVQATLVHELTHALVDQHVDLSTAGGRSWDHGAAVQALVEGDATMVEEAWVAGLDGDAYDRYTAEMDDEWEESEEDLDDAGVPEAWEVTFALPYMFGPPLVAAVLDDGGPEALWELYESDAPFATRAAFDLATDPLVEPEEVEPPTPRGADGAPDDDREIDYTDTLGVFEWAVPLAEYTSAADTADALSGWRGDTTVVSIGEQGDVCLDADIAMADTAAAARFMEVAGRWIDALPLEGGPEVGLSGELVSVHVCDPGEDVEVGLTGAAGANLGELAERNWSN